MDILILKQCSVIWNCLLITTKVEEVIKSMREYFRLQAGDESMAIHSSGFRCIS